MRLVHEHLGSNFRKSFFELCVDGYLKTSTRHTAGSTHPSCAGATRAKATAARSSQR